MKKVRGLRASGFDTVLETMMGLEGWLFRDSAWHSGSAFNLCSSHGHPFCRQVPETCEEDEFRAEYKTTKSTNAAYYIRHSASSPALAPSYLMRSGASQHVHIIRPTNPPAASLPTLNPSPTRP